MLVWCLSLSSAGVPRLVRAQDPGVIAFVGVNVVPMDRERVLEDQTVVVRDGRIVAVGPTRHTRVPTEAVRVEGRGQYLLPGLGDLHMHLPDWKGQLQVTRCLLKPDRTTCPTLFDETSRAIAAAEQVLLLHLANGVTTVRVMNGDPEVVRLRERAARGELLSPRISTSTPSTYGQYTVAEAVAIVEGAKAAGYDFVKMYNSSDAWDSTVAAARRVGLPIAGHLPSGWRRNASGGWDVVTDSNAPDAPHRSFERAVRAGYRSIEHASEYLIPDAKLVVGGAIDTARVYALGRLLVAEKVWLCPTLTWEYGNPYAGRFLVDSLRQAWRYANRVPWTLLPDSGRPAKPSLAAVLKTLHDMGVGFLLGTDAISGSAELAVHRELALMVEELGFTPYQALLTGTRNVADFLETSAETGTIAVGKRADLVLVRGNPLANIRHTAEPAGVMIGGRWLDRAGLDRRLLAVEGMLE